MIELQQKGWGNIMQTGRLHYPRPDTLDFLHSHINELRIMAEVNKLDLVAYLLEMAYVELGDVIRRERPFASHRNKSVRAKTAV